MPDISLSSSRMILLHRPAPECRHDTSGVQDLHAGGGRWSLGKSSKAITIVEEEYGEYSKPNGIGRSVWSNPSNSICIDRILSASSQRLGLPLRSKVAV